MCNQAKYSNPGKPKGGNAGKVQDSSYTPVYADIEECTVCNAAVGKKSIMHEPK